MYKVLACVLLLCSFALSNALYSDNAPKKQATDVQPSQAAQGTVATKVASVDKPKPHKLTAKEIFYDKSEVLNSINEILAKLKAEKSNEPLESVEIQSYSNKIKIYITHPFIETQSTLSKIWLKKLAVCLDGMANMRRETYLATVNKKPQDADKAAKEYKNLFEKLDELVKKPEYVEKKSKGQ